MNRAEGLSVGALASRFCDAARIAGWSLAFMVSAGHLDSAQAQLSVGSGGTPSYAQALPVPPGAAGMSPNLSLVYAGGGVDGPYGYGWSVQGISTITRCPSTVATDGKRIGVVYGPGDKLCLDGQRLIQTNINGNPLSFPQVNDAAGLSSGSYTEFRTEKDSYARIRSYGYANGDSTGASGPAYFKVWTKSGQIYEYGASSSADANTKSLITPGNTTAPIAWAVTRISDTLGNYIDFKYEQRDVAWGSGPTAGSPTPGHEWNLQEIQYSGNKVVFNFDVDANGNDQRPDKAEAYQQGIKNVSLRRIKSITTYINSPNTTALGPASNAVAASTTQLGYDTGPISGRSRVISVKRCSGGPASTTCLPATTFSYAPGGSDAYQPIAGFDADALATLDLLPAAGTSGVLVADFNGDGRADILYWNDSPALNKLYLSNGDGHFTQASNFNITTQNILKSDGCYVSLVVDLDGDGLPDLFRYSAAQNLNAQACASYGPILIYHNNGDGSFTQQNYTGPTLLRLVSNQGIDCLQQAPLNFLCADPTLHLGWSEGDNFYFLDVDGDGLLDIVTTKLPAFYSDAPNVDACLTSVCTQVFRGTGGGNFTAIPTNLTNISIYAAPAPGSGLGSPKNVGDINGDGLADLVGISTLYFNKSPAFKSNGDGTFTGVTSGSACQYPIDFNGDGRLDCLTPAASGTSSSNALSVSDGTLTPPNVANFSLAGQTLNATNAQTGVQTTGIQVADINGDGRADIIRWSDTVANNALFLSNGDGTFTPSTTFGFGTAPVQLQSSDGTNSFALGDFTGHGNAEILRLETNNGTVANHLYVKVDPTPPDQLTSYTSGSGATTSLYYVPLGNPTPGNGVSASLGPRYLSDRYPNSPNLATLPMIDMVLPIYVVATSVSDSGVGNATLATEYSYEGLKADTAGRGLLGFRELLTQSVAPDSSLLTVDSQNLLPFPYTGTTSQSSTYWGALNATASSQLLSKTVNVYCDQGNTSAVASATSASPCPVTGKVARPYLYQSVETGNDLAGIALPTVTTQNSFDGAGNPLQISVTTTGSNTFTKTTNNQYIADNTSCSDYQTCNWVLGRLSQASVTSSVPNLISSITTSAGSGANATATSGNGPLQQGGLTPSLSFGSVTVGASTTLAATLANDGANAISITVPSASSVTGTDFSFVSTTCSTSLAPGANCQVTVSFAPSAATARSGSLTVATGGGSLSSSFTGSGSAPSVSLVPQWTSWGVVGAASDSGDFSTVVNNSNVPVLLTAHAPASNPTGAMWSWTSTSAGICNFGVTVLAPGGSCQTFFGTGLSGWPGTYTAVDQVNYQAQGVTGSTFSVQQSYTFGIGSTQPSPGSLSFGNVSYSGNSTLKVTLTNGSDDPFDSLIFGISGANAANFSISANTCSASLAGHASCVVSATFTAGSIASGQAATLVATGAYARYTAAGKSTYYPANQNVSVGLSASGMGSIATLTSASTLAVPATWFASQTQTVNATYKNNGNAPMTLATPVLSAPLSVSANSCSNIAVGSSCSMTIAAATNVAGLSQSQSFTPSGAAIAPSATTVTWTTYSAIPSWSPAALSFGGVEVGGTRTQNITLSNNGNVAYNWASVNTISNAPAGFSFNTSACTNVTPGGSCTVGVTFAPTAAGSFGGGGITMQAASNNQSTFSVSGTGLTQPSIAASLSTLVASAVTPTPASGSVSFTNNGQTATTLTFAVTGGLSVSPATLNCPASGSCGSVTVSSPTSMGTYNGTLSMSSSTGGSVPSVSVSLTVQGSIATLTSAATLAVPATWFASPTQTVMATYKNNGSAPMTLATPVLSAPLSVSANTCSNIAVGSSCSMTIAAATNVAGLSQSQSFTPSGAGVAPAATTVTWSTYSAVPGWSPSALSFAGIEVGTTSTQNITLTNNGNVAYNWASVNTISNAPAGFSFNTSACTNVTPGGSCSVGVTFAPTAGGNFGGSGITMQAASNNLSTFSVSGTGLTQPSIAASVGTVSGTSVTPAPAAGSVSFTNNGQTATTLTFAVTSGLSVSPSTLNCPVSGSCGSVTVSSPTAMGTYTGTLSMSSSTGGSVPFVPVSLTVQGSIATLTSASAQSVPATWFGSSTQTVMATYKNNGSAPMTLATPALSAPLSVSANTCSNIAVGSSCSMTIAAATNIAGINQSQSFVPTGAVQAPAATTVTWSTYTAVPSWSPTSLAFGSIEAGVYKSMTIGLTNSGNTAYNWASNNLILNAPAGFYFDTSACTSVTPGAACLVTVTFEPTTGGNFGGSSITMQAASNYTNTFSVSGTGLTQPSITASTSSISSTTVTPTAASGTVSFTNNGQSATVLTLSASGGASLSASTLNCPGNGSCGSVTVTSPASAGSYNGTLSVTSSTGGSVPSVSLNLTVMSSIATLTSASAQSVPATWYGQPAQTVIATYRNDGTAPLTLSSPALSPPLSVTANNCASVASGSSCSMTVSVATNVPGVGQSQSFVPPGASQAPAATSVTWTTYTAVPSWSPTSLNFGNVEAGFSSANQNVTLTNNGNVFINWASSSTIQNAPAGFSFDTSACTNVVAGGNCVVHIAFTPSGSGSYGGSGISMAAASYNANTISVSGTGLSQPNIVANPSSLSVSVNYPSAPSGTISFTNSGQTAATLTLAVPASATLSTTTLNCPANGSCGSVTVSGGPYIGTTAGNLSTSLSSVGSSPTVAYNLVVNGSVLSLQGNAALNFGTVNTGSTAPQLSWKFYNAGNIPMTLSLSALSSPFSVVSNTCSAVPASGTCTITVAMSTATANSYSQSSIAVTGATTGNLSSLSLTGAVGQPTTTLTASPSPLAFGTVGPGIYRTKMLTLTNTGSAAAVGLNYVLSVYTGANKYGAFDVAGGGTCPAAGGSLAAGASCTLEVDFSAACSAGSVNTTVTTSGTNFTAVATPVNASTSSGICN